MAQKNRKLLEKMRMPDESALDSIELDMQSVEEADELANEEEPEGLEADVKAAADLSSISDDELRAEIRKRGLRLDAEAEAAEEDDQEIYN